MKLPFRLLSSLAVVVGSMAALRAADADAPFSRQADVIYGRKFGTALTMDVFTPKSDVNGRGVVYVVSGGWYSAREAALPSFYTELARRGYTVFAVVHGSQPK